VTQSTLKNQAKATVTQPRVSFGIPVLQCNVLILQLTFVAYCLKWLHSHAMLCLLLTLTVEMGTTYNAFYGCLAFQNG